MAKGSAEKRHAQSLRRRLRNKAKKSEVRTGIKKFLDLAKGSDKPAAETEFRTVESLMDSAARKGVFHRNTAARQKSRLQTILNKMGA